MRPAFIIAADTSHRQTSSWALEPTVVLRFFGAMIDDASISKARLSSEVMQMMIPIVRISNDPNEGKDPKLGTSHLLMSVFPR